MNHKTRLLIVLMALIVLATVAVTRGDEPAGFRPASPSPRKRVAVARFDALGSFVSVYSNWDIGGGLEAMLQDALVRSDQFVVVDRANLPAVLSEQQLGRSGLVTPESSAEAGRLLGAQFLIFGSVTEFALEESSKGFNIGFSSGGGSPVRGRIAPRKSFGHVVITIRVVDSTSGEVVESYRVEEKTKRKSFGLDVGFEHVSFGSSDFDRTPLGEATRNAVDRAVARFAEVAARRPWSGRIVDADGTEIFINAGAGAGIHPGDRFLVRRVDRVLTDPDTGAVLGSRSRDIGTIEITGVEERMAWGRFRPTGDEQPARGDVVASGV